MLIAILAVLSSSRALVAQAAPPPFELLESATTPDSAQEEEELPMDEWTGSMSLFLNYADGNTDSNGFGFAADAQYRREKDRTTLKAFYDKKFSEDDRVVDRRFADAKYDYFLSEKTYWWGKVRFDVDREADLELQSLASTGIGHQFADTDTWKFNTELGLSYVDQDFDDPAPGDPDNDTDYVAARLGYNADYVPDEKWSLSQSTDYYPSLEDSDEWYLVTATKGKVILTESVSGSITYMFSHQETPAAGKVQDDHNVLLGIDWNF